MLWCSLEERYNKCRMADEKRERLREKDRERYIPEDCALKLCSRFSLKRESIGIDRRVGLKRINK